MKRYMTTQVHILSNRGFRNASTVGIKKLNEKGSVLKKTSITIFFCLDKYGLSHDNLYINLVCMDNEFDYPWVAFFSYPVPY